MDHLRDPVPNLEKHKVIQNFPMLKLLRPPSRATKVQYEGLTPTTVGPTPPRGGGPHRWGQQPRQGQQSLPAQPSLASGSKLGSSSDATSAARWPRSPRWTSVLRVVADINHRLSDIHGAVSASNIRSEVQSFPEEQEHSAGRFLRKGGRRRTRNKEDLGRWIPDSPYRFPRHSTAATRFSASCLTPDEGSREHC